MKHGQYEDGQVVVYQIDKYRSVIVKLSTVGITPSKVSATWTLTGGKTGTAFGGFQRQKDFDFQTAAAMAYENAIAQATA